MILRTLLFSLLLTLSGFAQSVEAVKTIIHTDRLGSPIMGRSMDGETVFVRHYEPYGQSSSTGQDETDVGYTGHLTDPQSGLVYAGARWYQPGTERFLSSDPQGFSLGSPASFNRYIYSANNPFKYKDPTGASPSLVAVAIGLLIISQNADAPRLGEKPHKSLSIAGAAPGLAVATGGVAAESGPMAVTARSILIKVIGGVFRNSSGSEGVAKSVDDLFKAGRTPKASQLTKYAEQQGWKLSKTANGPLKYIDENGVNRLTIKQGSSRAPGSASPHVELRNASGQRVDPAGNPVTRKSPGNHTPIDFDL